MITLGVESSCDETSCAVLKGRDKLLANVISSSLFRHKPFGGVVPEIASRHSLEQIDTVFKEALSEAGITAKEIDLVAVTYGPGLIGSLFVGVSFAKMLAYQLGVPLVGVNHLEAHLVANFIGKETPEKFIGLLVSGGHTSLSLHKNGKVQMLGSTVDDAVGEAFDKVAKLLGLGFPGGPVIEAMAKEGIPGKFTFTRPKQKEPFEFSFSGIKTAVLREVQKFQEAQMANDSSNQSIVSPSSLKNPMDLPKAFVCDLSRGFQESVVAWLIQKTLLAAAENDAKHIVVGGGVSANRYLRESLQLAAEKEGVHVLFPEMKLALDNAGMIARRGIELYEEGERATWRLTGVPNLKMNSTLLA